MKTKIILLAAIVFSLTFASIGLAEYATTAVYFNVPSDTGFRIAMPSTYSWQAISGGSEAAATPTSPSWISFNFSSVPETWTEPYAAGVSGDTQNGVGTPIFYIDNNGNVDENFTMYWNSSSGVYSYFNVSINGSCSPDNTFCDYELTTATNLTSSALKFAGGLNSTGYYNLTMYGFVDTGAPGGETGGVTSANIITNNSAAY